MTDFKLTLPIAAVVTVGASIATGLIAMKTHEAALSARVDAMERSTATIQVEMQSLTSRNEFLQFREDFNRQMADVLARLRHIDDKVTRR